MVAPLILSWAAPPRGPLRPAKKRGKAKRP
jgi:hypothetical protein